jgi:hypothetical protein
MTSSETMRGYEEPFGVQFSIFFANRVGQFKDLLDFAAEKGLYLLGLSIVDSCDWSVVRAVFSDPNKARAMLQDNKFSFTESTVLLAVLDEDDALPHIFELLLRAEINMYFVYPLMIQHANHPVMVIHVDDDVTASHLLVRHKLTLLGREDLADPH